MALGDGKALNESKEVKEELSFILDAVTSIGDKLVQSFEDAVDSAQDLNDTTKVTSKTLQRGLVSDIKSAIKNTEDLYKAQAKSEKGLLKQSELQRLKNKLLDTEALFEARKNLLASKKLELSEKDTKEFEDQIKFQKEALDLIEKGNSKNNQNKGLLGLIKGNLKGIVDQFDKSGVLSSILNTEIKSISDLTRVIKNNFDLISQVALAGIVNGAVKSSKSVAELSKQTGISSKFARELQNNFAGVAANSDKVFITSERLNQSFRELTSQFGIVASFGGDILETQTTLTRVLKFSSDEAGRLSTLSRIQSKDTEQVLENTVSAVNALSNQNKVGLDTRGILQDIANVSAAIAVSLGKNPVEIGKAVAQAKLLGIELSEVDAVAESLLNFEQSISNELQAELLIGKDINLERARLLALNNDLAGLGEELKNQEEIRLAFANGNRIQQQAAADAIGVSRDQLAKIVLQQDLARLGAEGFKEEFGEATFNQLQTLSISEKFEETLNRIKGVINDIGLIILPIVEGFATLVSSIGKSKFLAVTLTTVLGGLAAKAAITALSFGLIKGGLLGGLAITAALLAGGAAFKRFETADDMIAPAGYGERILSTPKGSIALNNKDTIVAGTNLGGGSDMKETNSLLKQILTKQGTVQIDSTKAGTAFTMGTYQVQ